LEGYVVYQSLDEQCGKVGEAKVTHWTEVKVSHIVTWFVLQVSPHDGLPQQICYECLSRIELFHGYKQSCLESQHTLKHWNLFCEGGEIKVQSVQNECIMRCLCLSVYLSAYMYLSPPELPHKF
jgi:hypothetical protein